MCSLQKEVWAPTGTLVSKATIKATRYKHQQIPQHFLASCFSFRTVDFAKQMVNVNVVNHFSPPPLALCPPAPRPPTPSSSRAPPIPPPDPAAVQQQCERSGRGSAESGALSRPDLPGGAAAQPPAGSVGLHLRRAAAALSVQLGRARQVRTHWHRLHY